MKYVSFLFVLGLIGCDPMEPDAVRWARNDAKEIEEVSKHPCVDQVTLIATTAGSPNSAKCKHPQQKARVEVATKAGEEIGVTVFCECHHEDKEE